MRALGWLLGSPSTKCRAFTLSFQFYSPVRSGTGEGIRRRNIRLISTRPAHLDRQCVHADQSPAGIVCIEYMRHSIDTGATDLPEDSLLGLVDGVADLAHAAVQLSMELLPWTMISKIEGKDRRTHMLALRRSSRLVSSNDCVFPETFPPPTKVDSSSNLDLSCTQNTSIRGMLDGKRKDGRGGPYPFHMPEPTRPPVPLVRCSAHPSAQ